MTSWIDDVKFGLRSGKLEEYHQKSIGLAASCCFVDKLFRGAKMGENNCFQIAAVDLQT